MKVLLILSDGMRPDACKDNKVIKYLCENGSYSMSARTVIPSVTLPCHISLFHSVDPERHGTTTNTYAPQVRPIRGLFEVLKKNGKNNAMFYTWEQLRDISRPDSLAISRFDSQYYMGLEKASREACESAKTVLKNSDIDFCFLYLGWPDEEGHDHGWMGKEYLYAVDECCNMVGELIKELGDEYVIIYTADHGGHDRVHGTELPEDMTIPVFFLGKPFEAGKELENVSLKDIAPTIADIMGCDMPKEWEGKSQVNRK